MKGLKFLFGLGFRHIVLNIISVLFVVAMPVVTMLLHEPSGSEDYMMCKIGAHIGTMFAVAVNIILLCAEVTNSRFVRSIPFAKQLRQSAIPLYCVIVSGVPTVLINGAYAVFCIAAGLDMCNISDMLIVSASTMVCFIIIGTIALNTYYGICLAIFATFPAGVEMLAFGGGVWKYGFGLPVWAGAAIFLGALAVSAAIAFALGRFVYSKSDFKPYMQNSQFTA